MRGDGGSVSLIRALGRGQDAPLLRAVVGIGRAHAERVRHADLALGVEVTIDVRGGLDV